MQRVTFRFYAELNDHLPAHRRQVAFDCALNDNTPVADALALLGVPAEEVELLLVNGESMDLLHRLRDGDRVSVYPRLDALDVAPLTKIRHRPRRRLEFILDVHLGKLAHQLRMLGFDTVYRNDSAAEQLRDIAIREDRILLSKSRALIASPGITAGYRIASSDTREQLIDVLERFDLWRSIRPFTRCLHCNSVVEEVGKAEVVDRLPPKVRGLFDAFTQCPACGRVYWLGTHCARMREYIRQIFVDRGKGPLLPPGFS